jgi:hypothetical protein
VQAHAHPDVDPAGPLLLGKGALRSDRPGNCVTRAREGEEERVALRVDLLSAGRAERLSQMLRSRPSTSE